MGFCSSGSESEFVTEVDGAYLMVERVGWKMEYI